MLAEIKPGHLFFFRDPEPNDRVNRLEKNVCSYKREDPYPYHCDRLDAELRGISEEQAVRPRWIDGFGGEQSSGDGSPRAPHAMNAECIKRVVISKSCFDHDGEITDNPRPDSY